MKVQWWSRNTALIIRSLGPREEVVVVNATPRPLYPREKASVLIAQEAGRAKEMIGTGVEKRTSLDSTGIRIPSCPARRDSLCALRSLDACGIAILDDSPVLFV